ncbi:MAG: anti-sigma factor [Chloroflexi bacterium]|nr:anti-sigma factor [Chloroflexota bacterium]
MRLDHAAAHERIADLALEPGRLAALEASPDPLDRALVDHAAGCDECRAEIEAWRRTQALVALGVAGRPVEEAAIVPLRAPESVRDRVLASAGAERPGAAPSFATRARGLRLGWGRRNLLAMAAAVLVLVAGAGLVADQLARLDELAAEARRMQYVVRVVDRVMAAPNHRIVDLREPDGTRAGSVSWSSHDFVVLTTALAPPAEDKLYRCWLSDDGAGWAVGEMYFVDQTGYWVGELDEWATFEIGPTTVFRVSLEPADGDPAARSGPIVLEAALGS